MAAAAAAAAAAAVAGALPRGALAASCEWSGCYLGVGLNPWSGCQTGYSQEKSEGYACRFGICAGNSYKCCPSEGTECRWYDASCNWDNLQDNFDDASDALKDKYEDVADDVKDKISDASKFTTATAADLLSVDDDVLAHLKATDVMTAAQLKGIKNKVKDMSEDNLKSFLGHVNKDALKDSLKDFGELDFGDKAGELLDAAKEAFPSGFDTSALNDLGNLVPELSASDLADLTSSALEGATGFASKLSASQMTSLGGSLKGMSLTKLQDFVEAAPAQSVLDSLKDMTTPAQGWSVQKAGKLLDRAKEALPAQAKDWKNGMVEKLGPMIDSLPVSELADIPDVEFSLSENLKDLSGSSLAGLRSKFKDMSKSNFNKAFAKVGADKFVVALPSWGDVQDWTSAQKTEVKSKVESAYGATKDWTGDQVNDLGSFLGTIIEDKIPELSTSAFEASVEELRDAQDWATPKLQELGTKAVETWGSAEDWTEAQTQAAGKIIGGLSETELPKIRVKFVAALDGKEFVNIDFAADPNVFKKALPALGAYAEWKVDQASHLVGNFKEAYGAAADWTTDGVDDLQNLVEAIPVDDIIAMSADVLSETVATAKMTQAQLESVVPQLHDMSKSQLQNFFAHVDEGTDGLGTVLGAINSEAEDALIWATEQKQAVSTAVLDKYGDARWWTEERLEEIDNLVAMIPAEELMDVAEDVLAESAAVAKLKADQVSGLAQKVADMTEGNIEKFVDKVATPVLEESIAALGAFEDWTAEKGPIVVDAMKKTWGAADTWKGEQLDKLDNLVAQIPVEELKQVSKEALSTTVKVAKLTGAQLSGIAEEVADMTAEQMETFMDQVGGPAFEASVEAFGQVQDWADDKAPIVLAKAKAAWGETSNWGSQQLDDLNALAQKIPVDELKAISAEALAQTDAVAQMTGEQIAALTDKAHAMSQEHFDSFMKNVGGPAFDASVEAFGKAKSWSEKKAPILKAKVEEVWGPAKDWSGEKINKLGSFAHAAVSDHIPELAGDAFSEAAELLGEHADWSAATLALLSDKAEEAWGPVENWGGEQINKLGSITHEALHDQLPKISSAAFDLSIEKLGQLNEWSSEEMDKLGAKAKEAWGPVDQWSGEQMNKMGNALERAVMKDIPKISTEAFKVAGELLGKGQDWTGDQLAELVAKSKESYGELSDWSDETLEALGVIAHQVITDDIPRMSNKMFEEAIVKFGQVKNYDLDEKLEFKDKALEVWGPVSSWSGQKMNKMGNLLGEAIRNDIPKISAAAFAGSVKTLTSFGEWTSREVGDLKDKAVESWGPVKDWSVNNVRDLGGMTKDFVKDDLNSLSNEAFKVSLEHLKDATDWSKSNLNEAGVKAKEAYGGVSGWSKDTVKDLGGLVAGLKSIEIPKLSVEASVSLEPAAVENMDSEQTAAFSADQVEAMPSESKKRFSGEKLKTMNGDAKEAAVCAGGPWCPNAVVDMHVKRSADESPEDVLTRVAESTNIDEGNFQVLYEDFSGASSTAVARRAILSSDGGVVVLRYGSDEQFTHNFAEGVAQHPDIELDGEPVLVRIRAEPRGEEASEGASGGEEPVRGDENEWKGSGLSTHEGKSSGDTNVGSKSVLGNNANVTTIGVICGAVVALIIMAVVTKTVVRRRTLAQGGRYNKYSPREEGTFSEMMQAQAPRNSTYNPMNTP